MRALDIDGNTIKVGDIVERVRDKGNITFSINTIRKVKHVYGRMRIGINNSGGVWNADNFRRLAYHQGVRNGI